MNCPHSRRFIKQYDELAAKMADRKDVVFLAVSIDPIDQMSRLEVFIAGEKLNHLQYVFSGNDLQDETYLTFKPTRVPYLFLLNPYGLVVREGGSADVVTDVVAQ